MKPELVLDIETTDKNPWNGRLICAGWQADDLRDSDTVVDVGRLSSELRDALADPDRPVVCHSTFDVRWLVLDGYTVGGPLFDTMVMGHLLDENTPLSLAWCAERYADTQKDERLVKKGGRIYFQCDDGDVVPLEDAPLEEVVGYNAQDVRTTKRLFLSLRTRLQRSGWYETWLDECVPLTATVVEMETTGMPIDLDANDRLRYDLDNRREFLRRELYEDGELPLGFNINSDEQVAAFLFLPGFDLPGRWPIDTVTPLSFVTTKEGRKWAQGYWPVKGLGLEWTKIKKDPKTGKEGKRPPVDTKSLLAVHGSHPWVQKLVEWRKLDTLLTNYIEKFSKMAVSRAGPIDDRIFGRFNQTGTVTGRLSSSEPNLQNIPSRGELGRRVRSLFRGDLVVGDFSQLEPRLMAHWSQDPFLLDVFNNDDDIYLRIASEVLGKTVKKDDPERDLFKLYVLALDYGAQARKQAMILSAAGYPTTQQEAADTIKRMESILGRFFEWKDEVVESAMRLGYVETLAGRRRRLVFNPNDYYGGYTARQAANAVIQGSAADVTNRLMVATHGRFDLKLLAQIHDELVWECGSVSWYDEHLWTLRDIAETGHGFDLSVPLKFEVKRVSSWADK